MDSFTSDTTSTSHSTSHDDGTDGSQNFTVDSESGSTSNYQETFGSPGNPGGTTNDGHTVTVTPPSFAFQATYTKTGSDHSTLHASGTIVAGVASYSGYNYQNTAALNFSLTASGGFGSMAVSAGGSSTTSVVGSGASAVTTSSTTVSYSVNLQYLGWQVINPSDSYTVNKTAVTALLTSASQGWSWVVSQASAAWQGLTDVAWSTVQTVWSGLQQAYTWMVSAGEWAWGVATTVVTFVCDTATMVANGATFGMIPSLSAKANELRQYYGETYFWICNITGGAVTIAAIVGVTAFTFGGGPVAAAGIVGMGASLGVVTDGYVQLMRMADGNQAPWEWNYEELAMAGLIGAVAPAGFQLLGPTWAARAGIAAVGYGGSVGGYNILQGNYYEESAQVLMSALGAIGLKSTLGKRPGKYGVFQASEDLLLERLGPAHISNPEEYASIMEVLEAAGVDIDSRPGSLAYSPSTGRPGRIVFDPDASIGALRHEYKHFLDNQSTGFPGLGYYYRNVAEFAKLEVRGYLEEIMTARQTGNTDLVPRIIMQMKSRVRELLGS